MRSGHWALRELHRWRTSPGRFLLALAPLLATAFCLFVYSARTVRELPVAVVDLDGSSLSRTLRRDLDAAPQIRGIEVEGLEQAGEGFRRGVFRAVVVLPDGLDLQTRTGRTARVVVWRDATNPMASNQLYSAIATIVATENARLVAGRLALAGLSLQQAKEVALPLRTDPRAITNPSFDYLSNFAPGLFPVFLQMALMLAGGTMLPHGWRRTARPLRETTIRSLPWIGLYGAAALVYYPFVLPALGAPSTPILPTMGLLGLFFAASLLCGAVFGRLIQSPVKAGQFLLAFNTPAFPLSGYTFPEWAMPPLLRIAASPLPFSLFVDAYRGLAGWATARPVSSWIGLGVWAVVSLAILAIPGSGGGEETETVNRPDPVTGGFLHALRREFRRFTRTPGLSTIFFVAPAIYLGLYAALYAQKEEQEIPLAVVDAAASSWSRTIWTSLQAHPQLHPIAMTGADARRALLENRVRGVLELPVDLDERMRRREATSVPLLFVADRFLPANDLQRSVGEIFTTLGTKERVLVLAAKGVDPAGARTRANALSMDDRPLGNPRETYGDFMLPPLGILILHQLCLVASAFAGAAGTGAHRAKDMLARTLLTSVWFGGWLALWVAVALPALSAPIAPHAWALAALSLLGFAAASLAGNLFGILAREPGFAAQMVAFTSYPFFFMSGASWPREMFPAAIAWVRELVPLSSWITAGNRAMRLDAGVADVVPELWRLAALCAGWALALAAVCQILSWREKRRNPS